MIKIYGIKNCNTMKKTFDYLDSKNVPYEFHDYKKAGLDVDTTKEWLSNFGWQAVINTRGRTWRQLPDDVKEAANEESVVPLAENNPSMVKRPILVQGDQVVLGFDQDAIDHAFDLL